MTKLDFQQSWALFEMSLNCAIIFIYLYGRFVNPTVFIKQKLLVCFILVNAFFWPCAFLQLPVAGYVRGVTGDLSIMTSLLLWSYFFFPTTARMTDFSKYLCQSGVVLVALCFYPCALGLSMIDPYAWGYGSLIFLAAIISSGFCMWLAKWNRLVTLLALSLLAWCFSLHESTNLWDYLLDPFLACWCIVSLLRYFFHRAKIRLNQAIN